MYGEWRNSQMLKNGGILHSLIYGLSVAYPLYERFCRILSCFEGINLSWKEMSNFNKGYFVLKSHFLYFCRETDRFNNRFL